MIRARVINPEPLGLSGFAFAILIFNAYNADLMPKTLALALPIGLFYGGLIQLIAGALEIKTGNTLGLTAFGSYGTLCIFLALLIYLSKVNVMPVESLTPLIGVTLIGWAIFTMIMTAVTFRSCNGTLAALFVLLDILLVLLIVSNYTGNDFVRRFAGYEGILTALVAYYGVWEGLKNNVNVIGNI
jgi:hypothetical protein